MVFILKSLIYKSTDIFRRSFPSVCTFTQKEKLFFFALSVSQKLTYTEEMYFLVR